MTTDPAVPTPDVLAVERFRTAVTDAVVWAQQGGAGETDAVLADFPSAQFVHDVNSAGVPVRRLVVHGEWEVDPNPPAPQVQVGDIVHYADREFGEHDDWIVMSVPARSVDPGESLVLLTRAEWSEGKYVNTTARHVRIVSRPNPPKQAAVAPSWSFREGYIMSEADYDNWDQNEAAEQLERDCPAESPTHPFEPVRYKGRIEEGCGHFTRINSHEGRLCGEPRSATIHPPVFTCCNAHDDQGEAEPCCENCPDALPFRLV